jgi:hypothetical protein
MFEANQPVFGVSTMKQMTLGIKKFDGSEPYKGLGANFAEWGTKFMRQLPWHKSPPVSGGPQITKWTAFPANLMGKRCDISNRKAQRL